MSIRVLPVDQLTPDELRAWSDLQRANSELHNPFFRPEFALAVAKTSGSAEVAVFEQQGRPVAFFPFERAAGSIGQPIGGLISDMHGIIAASDFRCDIVQLLRRCGLCTWTFDHLLASQSSFERYHECVDHSLHMDMSRGFKAYCEGRRLAGGSSIQNAERRKRQLAREFGPVRFEWHSFEPSVMDQMCQWKSDQLRHMHYQDVFEIPTFHELLHWIRKQQEESFAGVLSALYAGDHLIAVQFGVQSHEVLSVAIPAYNPNFSKYSPGLILHLELARQSEEHGVTHIELGRGENQLKTSLMSGSIPLALGAVDLRPVRALMRKAWFQVRKVVYASPLRSVTVNCYRRIRNRMTRTTQPAPARRVDRMTEERLEPVEPVC